MPAGASRRAGGDIWLEVDGATQGRKTRRHPKSGADTFVAGSAVFGERDRAAAIRRMREALAGA